MSPMGKIRIRPCSIKFLFMKNLRKTILVLVVGLFTTGFVSNYFEITKNLEIFNNVYKEINSYYVDPVDPGELMHSTIDTMLKRLDPYTQYIPESEIEDFRFQTTGDYGGIGATIRKIDSTVVIFEPYKDFPADKAGLKMGDIILEINDKSVINASTEDVSELLKGVPGTNVNVKINRFDTKFVTEIKREKIHVPSVKYYNFVDDNIGYVKLRRFTKNCSAEVEKALNELEKKSNLNGLILDLRSNPGGLLNESISLTNLFIAKDEVVVTTNGKNTEWKKSYKTRRDPKYPEIPIVVLVNGSSASASEIVAGAIQDLDRGIIVGNRTFGKGLVQQSRKLNYNARLKVTVAKYYTPSGRCIQDLNQTSKYNDYLSLKNQDSLITNRREFLTKNKRVVYDGGGIDPDIKIELDTFPTLLISLVRNNHIFKYGNEIIGQFENISTVEECVSKGVNYDDFSDYLNRNEFSFEDYRDGIINDIEISISDLKEEDLLTQNLKKELKTLDEEIQAKKVKEIYDNKELITKRILGNILTRKFYDVGRIEYELTSDKYVNEAVRLLKDEKNYSEILNGNN